MDELLITTFDLVTPTDYQDFLAFKDNLLNLLSICYGEKYFGDDIYNQKFQQRNLTVLSAYIGNKLVGTLLIKDQEKLSGLGVLKQYRRQKIASQLINTAKQKFEYLYAEVATTSFHMQKLFKKLNFKILNDEFKVISLLNKQFDKVMFLGSDNGYITYVHTTQKHLIDVHKKFMIFEFKKKRS